LNLHQVEAAGAMRESGLGVKRNQRKEKIEINQGSPPAADIGGQKADLGTNDRSVFRLILLKVFSALI
jgi:hypothetical protein